MSDDEALAAIFGSESFARVLVVFTERPGELLAAGEVERLSGVRSRDSLYRALERGVRGGLLTRRSFGRTGAYEVNTGSPMYRDLKSLLSNATGVAAQLRGRLARHPGVKAAFIYGSAAAGRDTCGSDVDLFVIGEVDARALTGELHDLEVRLGREINVFALSPDALRRRLAIGEPFLVDVWGKPRIMVVGDEDSLPRPALQEPSPYFTQEMAAVGTARTYATVVVAGMPARTDEVTEHAIDEVEAWARRTRPDARAERASPQVGWWQVVPPGESSAVWQTWLYPGPVISVRSLTPATPVDDDAAIVLRRLAGWWQETLDALIAIAVRLGCESVLVGLTVNTYGQGNGPRLVDVDFTGVTPPTRGTPPGQVPPWTYATSPLGPHVPSSQIVPPAARSLLRHFSFRHLEETVRSLTSSLQAPGGR